MSLENSLRLLWIGGITNCSGPRSANTERFLSPRQVTVTGFSHHAGLTLYSANTKNSIEYFAHEADRFASAAFESLIVGSREDAHPRSTGWLLIRTYYAAFFALHALMRLHGLACTRVPTGNVNTLNKELLALFPAAPPLTAGLYLLSLQSDGKEVSCSKLDAGLGGSHEILWHLLEHYLKLATAKILANSDPENQVLALAIDDFRAIITRFGGASWFTRVRNKINYSHEYGTWFPYTGSTCDYQRIEATLSGWTGSPDKVLQTASGDELIQFAAACSFLVSTCSTTVRDLAFRSKSNSPFRLSSGLLVPRRK